MTDFRQYPLKSPSELFKTPVKTPVPPQPLPSGATLGPDPKASLQQGSLNTPPPRSLRLRSASLPPPDSHQSLPLNTARQTPKPVSLVGLGREIAPGVRLDTSRKSKDGAPIRVITVDPAHTQILPIVAQNGGPLSGDKLPNNKQGGKPLLAAINSSFFTPTSVIGDLQTPQVKLTDDHQPAMDKITDQRYFLAVDTTGQLKTGKGGLSENPGNYQAFMGGFPSLFTSAQVANLDADIRSGAFAKRATYGGASPETTISRSFVGVTAQGELLLVAAGEGRLRSQGVSIEEAARLLKSLGAREAYILDGGGSTSLYVKDTLYARTDGRQVHSYLGIYAR